jgi:hypothetical protein
MDPESSSVEVMWKVPIVAPLAMTLAGSGDFRGI